MATSGSGSPSVGLSNEVARRDGFRFEIKKRRAFSSKNGKSQATTSQAESGFFRNAEQMPPNGPRPKNESGKTGPIAENASACSARQERKMSEIPKRPDGTDYDSLAEAIYPRVKQWLVQGGGYNEEEEKESILSHLSK